MSRSAVTIQWLSDGLKLGEWTFINSLIRVSKIQASEDVASYPNQKTHLSRSGQPTVDTDDTQVTLSQWQRTTQMRCLRAELDFVSIDKIDVLDKLRRFTMVGTIEADLPKFASYCNLCVSAE